MGEDGSAESAIYSARVNKIENRNGSALFQSSYYAFDSFSGSGAITVRVGGEFKLVGVHVAAHDSTVGVTKPSKKGKSLQQVSADVQSICSELHGHLAYCLICEPSRVPSLIAFLHAERYWG